MAKIRKMKLVSAEIEGALDDGAITKEKFFKYIPLLIEGQSGAAALYSFASATGKNVRKLNNLLSSFAKKHPSVFKNGKLVEKSGGVMVGDVEINGTTYHFSSGYDGYMRIEPGNMTAEFLAKVKKEWLKSKQELDVTAINKDNPTAEELAEYGLADKPNDVWSLVEEADASIAE